MTREREDELLAQRRELQRRCRELIQRIVDARLEGRRDAEAIAELAQLSREEVGLTKPDFRELAII